VFFERAKGSKLYDVDGREYIDYVCSWGAILLGHADSQVVEAISSAAAHGASFGAPHPGEALLAREVIDRMPAAEMVRFVNSGSEATMSAIRLARAATGRAKVVKFEGNYHGAVDSLLAKAGSGVATLSLPDSAGVPPSVTADTVLARYNDVEHLREIFSTIGSEIAGVLVEPVCGNMGCVPPVPGFLHEVQQLCKAHGALFIADEVMTGFRVAKGGATELYRLSPDIVCMGKVIGGGLPVGAYGGRKDLMCLVAPLGPMYQAGTLSGNPIAMAAGLASLRQIDAETYSGLEALGARLEQGLKAALQDSKVSGQVQRVGSMISVFFTADPVTDFDTAGTTDRTLFARVFHSLLAKGIYLPPSALESWFLSASHTEEEIDYTAACFRDALVEASA
jgi:glutamate-1-semialdehyde 2,1-aminomutase